MNKMKVIYRKFPEGDVIALFPEIPGDDYKTCESYQHIGQHSSANDLGVIQITDLATPEEYADLHAELEQIYDDCKLVICFRNTHKMFLTRQDEYKRWFNVERRG